MEFEVVLSMWTWIEHKQKVFSFSMWKVYDECAFALTTSLLGVYCNCNQLHQTAEIYICSVLLKMLDRLNLVLTNGLTHLKVGPCAGSHNSMSRLLNRYATDI
jgi:hypothetical protein